MVDRNWIITYVNGNAKGADMVVSRFGSETLDTIAPAGGSLETLDLGTVTPKAGDRADTEASYASVLEATGLSADAAKTLGAIDTVSLRNSNPDIDNNGVFDATEGKQFTLDFHNRFGWVAKGDTALIDQFLTNGTLSIPIVILLDEAYNVIDQWGPRTKRGLELFKKFKNDPENYSKDQFYNDLQVYYAKNRGKDAIEEILELI